MVTITPATTTSSGSSDSTQTQAGTSAGNQSGSINNQQGVTATQTGSQTGNQNQMNVYQPWQTQLQATAGGAAGNYITSGAPPPGVVGADHALNQAYTDNYNEFVAPQIAASGGPGSPALASNLALGLEQLNANVYGTNLNAYENAIAQGGTLGFNAVGQTGGQAQATTGTSAQQSTSNTQSQQDWQQAMADLTELANHFGPNTNTFSPANTIP